VGQNRRKYTDEFKAEAVKLAKEHGFPHAARELNVDVGNIRRWASSGDSSGSAETLSVKAMEAENRRLKRENEYLKKINEVLKKSTAIFSKDHIGNLK
jgi:transposase